MNALASLMLVSSTGLVPLGGHRIDRRSLLCTSAAAAVGALAPRVASAASPITKSDAKVQIAAGYAALGDLLGDFAGVTEREGGDGVRRVLGTVGQSSPVYRIEVAFRALTDDSAEPPEYIEGLEEVMRNLQDADSQAYSANFIAFSSAKGTPAQYFARSKGAVTRARKEWGSLMGMLQLEAK